MTNRLSLDRLAYLIQFQHPEKILARLPGVNDAVCAASFGIDLETYQDIKAQLAANARGAAEELLADESFAALVDRLPFQAASSLVGLGDSITDDDQSWLEILRHLLDLRRPQDDIFVVNAGISGDTTAQMISRFLAVVQLQPAWVICMAGTNDARLHGQQPTKTLVSIAETAQNLAMLRSFAATQAAQAHWVWMTPAPVIEEQIAVDWFLAPMQVMWRNSDLAAIAEIVRRQGDPYVDLQAAFGWPARPELLLSDGLHPSLEGQKTIVRALVERLAALA